MPMASSPANGTDHTVQRVLLHGIHYGTTHTFGNTWWDHTYRGDSSTTRLHRGMTYTLTVRSGTATGTHLAAWLDLYETPSGFQADELFPLGPTTAPHEERSFTFDIPEDATVGYRTLRVRAGVDLATPDPCAQAGTGESEDYVVLIEGDRCIPLMYSGTTGGDSLSAVAIDGMPLPLTTGRSAYKDMGPLTGALLAGTSHALIITTGAYHNNRVGAWADWNGDGLFGDDESLGTGSNTTAFEQITLPFDVPADVPGGSVVPLRVRLYFAGFDAAACTDLYHGQTVDYSLTIDNTMGLTASGQQDAPRIMQGTGGLELVAPAVWSGAMLTVIDATGRVLMRDRVAGERTILPSGAAPGMLNIHLHGRAGAWTGHAVHLH